MSSPGVNLGDRTWTAPALLNSWAQVAGYSTVGFRKDGQGFVHLRGKLSGGDAGTTIFTLPGGYRPASGTMVFMFTVAAGGISGQGYISVATNGNVSEQPTNHPGQIALDGITFLAEG